MLNTVKDFGSRTGRVVLAAVICVLALFVLLSLLRFGFIYWIYATVEDWTTVRLGFDYYVSNLIATAFTAVFSLLVPTLAWYIFLGKKQAWGIGVIVGAQLLMCGSIYTVGSGVCFDRKTGKPLCYFADTPQGRVWSYTPGFDPASGKQFRLYTREIKEAEEQQKSISKSNEPQSRSSPVSFPTVYENNSKPAPTIAPVRQVVSFPQSSITPISQRNRETEKVAPRTESHSENKNFERELELEKIRQAEETRRQQILEKERREEEEFRRQEEENRRIRAEQERLQREERQRLEREERERQIALSRQEQIRLEKEKQKRETIKVIINTAQPIIERLTRRKN